MDRKHKCIVQRRKRQRYVNEVDTCCSGAAPNQLLIDATRSLRDQGFEQTLIESLDELSTREFQLINENCSSHWLTLRPISNDDTSRLSYSIRFKGAWNASKDDLFCQLDELAYDLWVPKIETTEMSLLTSKAVLAISYVSLLTYMKLEDHTRSTGKQNLSLMFVQLVLVRIDLLVTQFMGPVRSSQGAIDPEYRDGLVLLYYCLPRIKANQLNSTSFGACDPNLHYQVRDWRKNFDEELTKRFKADCKNGFNREMSFSIQKSLSQGLDLMKFSELSISLVSFHGTILAFDGLENFRPIQNDHPWATYDSSPPLLLNTDHMLQPSNEVPSSLFANPLHQMKQSSPTLSMKELVATSKEAQGQILNDQSYDGGGADIEDGRISNFLENTAYGENSVSTGSNYPTNSTSVYPTSLSYSFEPASEFNAPNESGEPLTALEPNCSEDFSQTPTSPTRALNENSLYADLNSSATYSGICSCADLHSNAEYSVNCPNCSFNSWE